MTNGAIGNALLAGTRAMVIGVPAWGLSQQLALFAGTLLAAVAFRWGQRNLAHVASLPSALTLADRIARSRDGLLVLFLVASAVELVVFAVIGGILDRYLFPMVPAAAILLLRGPAGQPSRFGRSHALAHAAFAWLAASAVVIAANSFAYDAARWREGEDAVTMGYEARTVDAGYEWVGYHASGAATAGEGPFVLTWYYRLIPAEPPCAVVSNSPLDDDSLTLIQVNRSAYLQYLFFGPAEPLYLYGAVAEGCPPLPGSSAATQAP
jgi:hypothetical protein